jgi:hypothetical protein
MSSDDLWTLRGAVSLAEDQRIALVGEEAHNQDRLTLQLVQEIWYGDLVAGLALLDRLQELGMDEAARDLGQVLHHCGADVPEAFWVPF